MKIKFYTLKCLDLIALPLTLPTLTFISFTIHWAHHQAMVKMALYNGPLLKTHSHLSLSYLFRGSYCVIWGFPGGAPVCLPVQKP